MSKAVRNNISGGHNINSGNQYNVSNWGANSSISIDLHYAPSDCQPSPNYETKVISLSSLKNEKIHELLLPALLTIADLFLWLVGRFFIDTFPWNIIAQLVAFILLIVIFGLAVCIVKDIFSIMRLKKIGQTCYFEPKHQIISRIFTTLDNLVFNTNTPICKNGIQRVFKNEAATIFEIKGCSCPYCQSAPIGYMRPQKWLSNSIEFVCDQNSDHTVLLDCKEIVLK